MPSPKPQPTHLKLVKGTAKKCRLNKREPRAPDGAPPTPGNLSRAAVAACYRAFKRDLLAMGVLTVADGSALKSLAETQAEVDELRRLIADAGSPVFESGCKIDPKTAKPLLGTGMWRARPEMALLDSAERRLAGLRASFGLDPSSRTKVNASPSKPADKATSYF